MTTPIPLFVELCAGTAALSLRLHRAGAKPPVSRMGSKSGYSDCLLRILGLIPGQRAAAYLWCEPDPGVRLLLHAYRSAPLARAAAAIIRGWAAEDPRALWERLRAEGPPRLPEGEVDAGEVARFIVDTCTSIGNLFGEGGFAATKTGAEGSRRPLAMDDIARRADVLPVMPEATITPDARHIDPREVARWAQITASNRLIHTAWSDTEGRWINTGDGGATFGGAAFCSPPERTAEGLDAAPADLPAVVAPDAREVDPREVARFIVDTCTSIGHAAGEGGFAAGQIGRGAPGDPRRPREMPHIAAACDRLPHLAAALIHPDARTIDPPALPPGTVVFCDPPYSDVAPMIPPVLAAQFLPLDTCGREEGDAALRASGLDHLREPVAHLRVAVFEVLRSAGVQVEVLDSVVERVVIDVVDDLVWSQFASDVALHDKTVLANAPTVAHEEPVPVLNPALALAGAADSCLGLDLRGDLRKFALRCQAQPGAAAKLSQAVAWAGCALSGRRTPCAREGGSTDLAGDLERHCLLRVRVRLDTNTHLRLPGRKTTGYAHDLGRAEVVALARRWAAAGATVAISEAEPIPELVAEGWYAVEITGERIGQKRVFSKQQAEWVTLNRPPAWVPPVQGSLF